MVWRYVSPAQDEEPIEGYKVRVWESDQNMITANDTIVPVGQKLESFISNLTPGKSYNMRVLAYSNGGDGRMSSPTHRFQMGKYLRSLTLGICIYIAFISVSFLGKTTRSHASRRYNFNLNTLLVVTILTFISAALYN